MHELAQLMYKLFRGRRDTWAHKRGDSYFRVTGKEMTTEIYERHLKGETIGIYPLLATGEGCFFAALDIDSSDLGLARSMAQLIPKPNYIERSRSGNHHIWMFFEEPVLVDSLAVACKDAIALGKKTGEHCNLYPLHSEGLGLLIALPLQQGLVTEGLTSFVDAANNLEAQYTFLAAVKYTHPPGDLLDNKQLHDLWFGQGKKTGDTSQSGYDFSFCVALLRHGYSPPAVKSLLRKRPGLHLNTEEYLEKTLEAATLFTNKPAHQVEYPAQPIKVTDWSSVEIITRSEFIRRVGERLVMYKEQIQQFDLFFAAIVANLKTKGRPVWILFIGPPGCGKTLPMLAVQYAPQVYMASVFRPTALISGWGLKGGEDMSLIPKLDGKILLVKDMSSLLSQHKETVAEVLGLLRDVYEGSCSKPFATGVTRVYSSRFGFIGATTPDIDAHWALNVRLGERFLRYRCRTTAAQLYEKIDRSLDMLGIEDIVDLEIEGAFMSFLKYLAEERELPQLSHKTEIGRLAQLGAILRTVVSRSAYGQEILVVPEWEEATRYAKSLAKIAMGLAYVRGKQTNNEEEIEDLKTLVRDAMDARVERICAVLYNQEGLDASEIASLVSLPSWTVRVCLENLATARVLYYQRNSFRLTWHFVPWLAGQIKQFKLWEKKETQLTERSN